MNLTGLTFARDRVAEIPGVLIPDFADVVRAMTALGLAAPAGQAFPQPLYVKSEGARTWQP